MGCRKLSGRNKKSEPDDKLLYLWCKDFVEALSEATDYWVVGYCEKGPTGHCLLYTDGTNLGQKNYDYRQTKHALVTDIKALISNAIPRNTKKRVKVNRLRSVDPDTLRSALTNLFNSCCKPVTSQTLSTNDNTLLLTD